MNQGQSTTLTIIRIVNITLAAVLAGVSLGILMGFKPQNLSPATYVEQQQNMLYHLRSIMPALVISATLVTVASALLQRHTRPIVFGLMVAGALLIACLLITLLGNKPIDDLMLTWGSASLPENWRELRDKWWTLHIWRTLVEFASFLIITWTATIRFEIIHLNKRLSSE